MVNCYDENMRDFAISNVQTKTTLEIFYQNFRGRGTKQTELFDNVCSVDFSQYINTTLNHKNDTFQMLTQRHVSAIY
jgi:hypothetical protein